MSGRVDQYRVTIVKYGTRSATRAEVYLNYHLYRQENGPIDMDYFFWLVQGSDGALVVDTGFSPEGGRSRNRTSLADVGTLLRHFGVEPSASPAVVLTHAHYDHIGNLGLFPTSEVFMARQEFEFWTGPYAKRAMFHHSVDDEGLDLLRAVLAEGRLRLMDGATEIMPGVEVVPLEGHTPGQCGVKVPTSDGVVLLASDAVHYYEEYEKDMLFMSVSDLVEMYQSFDRVRRMLSDGQVDHLVAGHDPSTLSRFDPVDGPYSHLAATIGRSAA